MLIADLEDFTGSHRPHGRLIADTGALTPNGYRLTVACPCGVTFERWITPEEAAETWRFWLDGTRRPRPSPSRGAGSRAGQGGRT
jgi:hypothetical protein